MTDQSYPARLAEALGFTPTSYRCDCTKCQTNRYLRTIDAAVLPLLDGIKCRCRVSPKVGRAVCNRCKAIALLRGEPSDDS